METVENYIRRRYTEDKQSLTQIAKEINCGTQYIKGYLRRMNIEISNKD